MLNLGKVGHFIVKCLPELTSTVLPINLLLIVMEFVRMIAHPLSRRVAGRVKVHPAILRYARRQGARIDAMGTEVIKTTPPEGGAVVVNTGRNPTSCRSLSTYNPQRNVDRHTSMRCRKASDIRWRALAPLGAQRIQFGQRRCINTINFTMYCAFAGHRAWIVAQAVQLIIVDTMSAQPLGVGHPVAVALFAS